MAQARRRNRYPGNIKRTIDAIQYLDPYLHSLSPAELTVKSDELRARARDGESLDELLPEAYALLCETAHRTVELHPYEEQLWGAIALHKGAIVEMPNGEGKTLTAAMPAYLNGLSGQRVHIATYNDYLARRDAQWMGPIYAALGLSVGVIESETSYQLEQVELDSSLYTLVACPRRNAYACDITYGIHADFALDYLHDNMVSKQSDIVQDDRLDYIIIDEADSVLIDLARSPAAVVASWGRDQRWYYTLLAITQQLQLDEDYTLYPQTFAVELSEHGIAQAEALLRANELLIADTQLYSIENAGVADQLIQTLRALHFYKKDRDYIVENRRVIPISSYTGRSMPRSSLSNGIQQAIEAKERLPITPERRTLATISYQHYFKLYKKMAGMTATAKEHAPEFLDVYGKQVVEIPPRLRQRRSDLPDLFYRTPAGRQRAVIDEVETVHASERPVLIDTHSIEKADEIGQQLESLGIPCRVLHAKHAAQEAEIIARAGQRGAVTVAAKMAGRGTDIVIDNDVAELDGLHVIGVERYESRHMDRQLIGRAGRQGKPGSSRFFISLDDDLMRRFNADRVAKVMQMVGMDEDMPLESSMVSRLLEQARTRVENYNFKQRQEAYEFDSVLDKQRRSIYAIRRKALLQADLAEEISAIQRNIATRNVEKFLKGKHREQWDIEGLAMYFCGLSKLFDFDSFSRLKNRDRQRIEQWLINTIAAVYDTHRKAMAEDILWVQQERNRLLYHLDREWTDHLAHLEELQEEIFLRSYIEENRLEWYSMESYRAFWEMLERIEVGFLQDMLALSNGGGERVNGMA